MQDFNEIVVLYVAEDDIFRCSFRKSFEIVAYFELHFLLLHEGELQDANADVFKSYPAHQKVIGHLAGQSSVNGWNLQEAVHQHLFDSRFAQYFIHVVRHSLILASRTREDRQGYKRDPIDRVVNVVAQCQQQLSFPEGSECVWVEFERFLEHFNCIFEAEVRALADDAPHAELEHLSSAKANLRKAIDEPCPLLIIADLPLNPLQHVAANDSIDDQVAKMQDSVGEVTVDHLYDGFKVLRSE